MVKPWDIILVFDENCLISAINAFLDFTIRKNTFMAAVVAFGNKSEDLFTAININIPTYYIKDLYALYTIRIFVMKIT